jgi:hypothetical protein
MNKITYKESIKLLSKIKEIEMINIDDNINMVDEDSFINFKGDIIISGIAILDDKNETFSYPINLDISLSKEQIDSDPNISIGDFSYTINENAIEITLDLKIDGLKEFETEFHTEENNEIISQEIESHEEIIENKEPDSYKKEPEILNEKQSLLSSIFKRNIKKDSIYLIHVVKEETSYEDIANLYNVDLDLLKRSNPNKEIEKGTLIFIPNSK